MRARAAWQTPAMARRKGERTGAGATPAVARLTEAGVVKPRRVNTRSRPTHRAVKPANRKTAASSGIFRLLPVAGG